MKFSDLLAQLSENPDLAAANQDYIRPQAQRIPATGSPLEARFAAMWEIIGGPALVQEYRFHPDRLWRFDFAHPDTKTAIEVEGGMWGQGRHNRPQGYAEDCEKYNAAILHGWNVFRLTGDMIQPAALEEIADYMRGRWVGNG